MLLLQDVEMLKELPGYKAILKAVLKAQIQSLVEHLSAETDEESVILTASLTDGTLCHLGSSSGKDFLQGREEIKTQFLFHCLKGKPVPDSNTDPQTIQSDGGRRATKRHRIILSPSSAGKKPKKDVQKATITPGPFPSSSTISVEPDTDVSAPNNTKSCPTETAVKFENAKLDVNLEGNKDEASSGKHTPEFTGIMNTVREPDHVAESHSESVESSQDDDQVSDRQETGIVNPAAEGYSIVKVEPLDDTEMSYSEPSTSQEMPGPNASGMCAGENEAESFANDESLLQGRNPSPTSSGKLFSTGGNHLEIKSDEQHMWDHSLSPSILAVYDTGIKKYQEFLAIEVMPGGSSDEPPPVSEDLLVRFISYCHKTLGIRYSSIKLYLCGIRFYYLGEGIASPLETCTKAVRIYTFLKTVKRAHLPPKRVCLPIDINILSRLVEYMSKGCCFGIYDDTLMKAACTLAFFGFLRCGEFTVKSEIAEDTNLCLGDITLGKEKIVVHLKQSKTDPFRNGVDLPIFATNNAVCPVNALNEYLKVRIDPRDQSKALFLLRDGFPLTRTVFADNLRYVLQQIGLDDSNFNGHSLRKGAAQTCFKLRMENRLIKTLGRWSSSSYMSDQTVIKNAHVSMSNALTSSNLI